MIVTINTDASHSAKYNCASFAFWAVCNQGKIVKSGVFKNDVKGSSYAEFMCVVNALHAVLNHTQWTGIDKIIINTDCLHVVHLINDRKSVLPAKRKIKDAYNKLLRNKGIEVVCRHVKAHTTKDDARSWVNRWCDKEAKQYLIRAIQNKKKELQLA